MKNTKTKSKVQKAKEILAGIEKERARLGQDKRATASYWNGDDWGSIFGMRDAEDWINVNLAKYLLKRISKLKETKEVNTKERA